MARRIAIGNHKGGSGKTSTVRNLAAALAEQGKRVLAIDLDPQANLSRRMGAKFDPTRPTPTTAEVIKSAIEGVAAQAIKPCGWAEPYASRIDVISSRFDLENRISEAGVVGAVLRLEEALAGVDDEYDFTLIDCPPSLGHLTQLALAASDWSLAIFEPEFDGVDGALRLKEFVENKGNRKAIGNPDLRMIGYIVNRVRTNMGAHDDQIAALPDTFGADQVWTPHIPERAADKDASDSEVPLRLVGTTAAKDQAALWSTHAQRLIDLDGAA